MKCPGCEFATSLTRIQSAVCGRGSNAGYATSDFGALTFTMSRKGAIL
jgi:hypothetical protein